MGVTPTMNIIALMVHGEYSTYVIFCLKTTRIFIFVLFVDSLLKTSVISTMKTTIF